jgi:hypothetical protein
MLEAGAIMVVLIGILAMGGATAVSYEILFKNSLEKMETRKAQQSYKRRKRRYKSKFLCFFSF